MKKYSIIQKDLTECFVCKTTKNIHIHHIFFGSANRKQSDKYSCIVALCMEHHTGNFGVHHNKPLDLTLKKVAQTKFEEIHGSREEFRKIFGKSYL